MGTARAFVVGSASSCAAWTASVPRPYLGLVSIVLVLISLSPGIWYRHKKTRPPPLGGGRGGCRDQTSANSSVHSRCTWTPVRLSQRRAVHGHAHTHHSVDVDWHSRSLGSFLSSLSVWGVGSRRPRADHGLYGETGQLVKPLFERPSPRGPGASPSSIIRRDMVRRDRPGS